MNRRNYIAAVAALLGTSGCLSNPEHTMTQEESKRQFDSIVEFESPLESEEEFTSAVRCVDEEAGVVLYGVENAGTAGGGLGLASVPLSETDLAGTNENEGGTPD